MNKDLNMGFSAKTWYFRLSLRLLCFRIQHFQRRLSANRKISPELEAFFLVFIKCPKTRPLIQSFPGRIQVLPHFFPGDRRQGYGRKSVHLLLDFLEKAGVAKQVYVEVLKGNLPSLTFFQNMGFEI